MPWKRGAYKGRALKEAIYASFSALGLDGAAFTAGKRGKVPYGQLKKYFRGQRKPGKGHGGKPEKEEQPGKYEDLQFYYHADHLGSSRYITDAGGAVYQHVEYPPFGETLVEGRAGAERTRYLYNGQELDAETGLYYYGARYYDPRIGMFYGVDPRAEKYPGISPYRYGFNNPLRFVDPNGLFEVETGKVEKGDNLTTITKQINARYGSNLNINQIAKANGIKDHNKIVEGSFIKLPGDEVELQFDLTYLKGVDVNYSIDLPGLQWEAVSGRDGFQNSSFQNVQDKGPIPEGRYVVNPERTQSIATIRRLDRLKGGLGRGPWPGLERSWGEYRTWITPAEGTNTHGRSGFSIHGGTSPGSAGCIDLTDKNNSFHEWLKGYGRPVNLTVKY